jgi:hypothetical protein
LRLNEAQQRLRLVSAALVQPFGVVVHGFAEGFEQFGDEIA